MCIIGPRIAKCVADRLKPGEFVRQMSKKTPKFEYFMNICRSKFGLSMPGLGYDTYRYTGCMDGWVIVWNIMV